MHLLAPTLLVGLIAAAVPLVVHLLLRPRPRRVIFPPLTMLATALASGQRAQRIRNVWLLLLRTLLVAGLVFLLAGPTCSRRGGGIVRREPVACVVVFDDSWSLRYALDARTTLLDRQLRRAAAFAQQARTWPQPSQIGLVWTDPTRDPIPLTADPGVVGDALRTGPSPHPHAAGLGAAMRQAAAMLQLARQPHRRIVVFTDNARHAWRDVPPGLLAGLEGATVSVRQATSQPRSNLAITGVSAPRGLHPQSLPLRLSAQIRADGIDADCRLVLREGGAVLQRLQPQRISAGDTLDVSFVLPPRAPGLYGFAVELDPPDRLGYDQRRYVVCQVGRRPRAWLVRQPGDATTDLTALLMHNLIAPETLPDSAQRVEFHELTPADLATVTGADHPPNVKPPDFVVLIGGVELNETQRRALLTFAERGATVLLVPGSIADGGDWPGLRRLIARSVQPAEQLDAVTSLTWSPAHPWAHDELLAEMTRAAVRRRIVPTGIEDVVAVLARYTDRRPAILERSWGRGRVVLLTTSPDPAWSELGVRAAGLLSWLYRLMTESLGPADRIAGFRVGEVARTAFAGMPGNATVRLENSAADQRSRSIRLVEGVPRAGWPTDQPGIVSVRYARDHTAAMYAVNWPPEESRLAPASIQQLRQVLGTEAVEIELPHETRPAGKRWWRRLLGLRDPARVLAFGLMAMLLLETWAARARRGAAVER